jgi:hypothetical protein
MLVKLLLMLVIKLGHGCRRRERTVGHGGVVLLFRGGFVDLRGA